MNPPKPRKPTPRKQASSTQTPPELPTEAGA
jgi:hypothetical protein